MPNDYIILSIIAILSLGGGLFLLHKAKNYREQGHHSSNLAVH
ncbi:MAG: hypothetical protein Q8O31_02385 [Rhodocyclaceae bacterium]|nr:hypothetical protein [Rhodocyclaceae bacterium]